MVKKIFCYFFKKKLKKMKEIIYPGKLGKKIYKKISKKAWKKWINKQTKIINEKKLNTNKKKDIKIIEKKMKKFFFKK